MCDLHILFTQCKCWFCFLVQIINTEWGAFSKRLPLTEFDEEMDAASINPGEQVNLHVDCEYNVRRKVWA